MFIEVMFFIFLFVYVENKIEFSTEQKVNQVLAQRKIDELQLEAAISSDLNQILLERDCNVDNDEPAMMYPISP